MGDSFSDDDLATFDDSVRSALDHIIAGDLDDAGWKQATLGVPSGGLGLRRAHDIALPAFIASHTAT